MPLILSLSPSAATAYDWLQFNGDPAHSGNNTFETTIDRGNVASLVLKFQVPLPAVADGAPVILQSVPMASGTRDLLFVTTRAGHLVALDAQTGAQVWSRQYGAGACRINNGGAACSLSVANPVCRFYLPPPYGDSHFYSASPAECAAVQARYPFFAFESPAVFYILLPDQITGACPRVRYRSIACGTTASTPIIATSSAARHATRWSPRVGSPRATATTR